MKTLDKYLIRGFLVPFTVCILIFCVLVILGRFFDKMEMFVRYHAHVKDIAAFLLFGMPFWLNMVLPVATMLALLFSLGQLYQRGEFTAFRGAGIPSWRLFMPYIGIGLLLSITSVAAGLTILPSINFQSRKIYRVNIKGRDLLEYRKDNVVVAGRDHRFFTIGWLDVAQGLMKDVVVDRLGEDAKWIETLSAKVATYQNGGWLFQNGVWRYREGADPGKVREIPFAEKWVPINEKPDEFAMEDKETDDMNWRELRLRTERLRRQGAPAYKEKVAWHMRWALPFANIIVIILAIPFALRSGSHGRTQNFSYALGLAFLYWGVTSICQSYGEHGQIPAWLAAWTSNVLFGMAAVWRLARLP